MTTLITNEINPVIMSVSKGQKELFLMGYGIFIKLLYADIQFRSIFY
jgi:hypothetical protein